jgi:hypothetical protein
MSTGVLESGFFEGEICECRDDVSLLNFRLFLPRIVMTNGGKCRKKKLTSVHSRSLSLSCRKRIACRLRETQSFVMSTFPLSPPVALCVYTFLSLSLSLVSSYLDPYHHARRSVENSFHDSNNINQNFSSEPTQPYFDFAVTRNVTTRVGQTAFLHCRVEDLGDKLVRPKAADAARFLGGRSHCAVIIFNFRNAFIRRHLRLCLPWVLSFTRRPLVLIHVLTSHLTRIHSQGRIKDRTRSLFISLPTVLPPSLSLPSHNAHNIFIIPPFASQ